MPSSCLLMTRRSLRVMGRREREAGFFCKSHARLELANRKPRKSSAAVLTASLMHGVLRLDVRGRLSLLTDQIRSTLLFLFTHWNVHVTRAVKGFFKNDILAYIRK